METDLVLKKKDINVDEMEDRGVITDIGKEG